MPTIRENIISAALHIIELKPDGIRFSELCRQIERELPLISPHYIKDIIVLLDQLRDDIVYKPERGLFRHIKYKDK